MKSSLITAMTIAGILGTATAAMAVNADTLKGIDGGTIGNAVEVLVPVVSRTHDAAPGFTSSSSPTPSGQPGAISAPESSRSGAPSTGNVLPAPSAPVPEAADTSSSNGSTPSGVAETNDSSAGDSGEDSSPEPTNGSSDDD